MKAANAEAGRVSSFSPTAAMESNAQAARGTVTTSRAKCRPSQAQQTHCLCRTSTSSSIRSSRFHGVAHRMDVYGYDSVIKLVDANKDREGATILARKAEMYAEPVGRHNPEHGPPQWPYVARARDACHTSHTRAGCSTGPSHPAQPPSLQSRTSGLVHETLRPDRVDRPRIKQSFPASRHSSSRS